MVRRRALLPLAITGALAAGCLRIASPDLFLLSRTGAAGRITLLINDGGTIRCNGGPARPLPDKLLIQARDLATRLDHYAKQGLRLPRSANSVAVYSVRLKDGTISFPDTAARTQPALAQLELFATQAAQGPCGLRG